MLSKQDKQVIEQWNSRLYAELERPVIAKQAKQARKARKQAKYRAEQLASLHAAASVNKPFVPKVLRRRASSVLDVQDCMAKQAQEKSSPSKLD